MPVAEAMRRWAPGWWAALAAALAYLPSLANGFVFDDLALLAGNPFFAGGGSLGDLVGDGYWGSLELTWRPVATASHLLESALTGSPSAGVGHGVNLLLHAAAAGLVTTVARVLLGGWWAPLAAGLLFAWHPGPSEAVLVVSYREDLLALVGMAAACWCALRAWVSPEPRRWQVGALVAALVALGSKETALLLPLLLGGLCWARCPQERRRAAAPWLAAHVALALGYAVLRFGPMRHAAEGHAAFPLPPGALPRIATGLRVLGEDLWLCVCPWSLSVDPWPPTIPGLFDARLLGPALAVAAVAALLVVIRGRPLAMGGILAGLALLAPTLPFSAIANLRGDRFVYVPLAAFAIAAAAGLRGAVSRWPERRRAVAGACVALAVLAVARLQWRIPDFRTDEGLWEVTLATDPTSVRARLTVGARRIEAGDVAGGLSLMREGVALRPEHAGSQLRLAEALIAQAVRTRDDALRAEAEAVLATALRLAPAWGTLVARQGDLARGFGDAATAIAHYRRALELDPGNGAISASLGTLLVEQRRNAEARPLLAAAVAQGADETRVLWYLAELSGAEGNTAQAVGLYRRLLGRADAPPQLADRLRALEGRSP